MIRTKRFLLSATAAVFMLAIAAPASLASTTVQPAGETVTGVATSGVSLTVESGEAFECNESTIKAEVPTEPSNTAEEGPVELASSEPALWQCLVNTGIGKFPAGWTTTSKNGPWSLGAEVTQNEETEVTETFLNFRTSPGGLVVQVPAIACTVTFFPNGDELEGKFDNVTSTVQYNGPASYDGSKCGALGSGTAVFKATYLFEGLSITP